MNSTPSRRSRRTGISSSIRAFFELRRTAAWLMTGKGISRLTAKKILNHAERDVTAVYDRHTYDPEKRTALDAWGRRLEAIVSGTKEREKICCAGGGRRERGRYDRAPLDHHRLHCANPRRGRGRMAAKLAFQYDREADILHISSRPPYAEQESEELGDDVIARLNPKTGDVESLEVLFFSTRLLRSDLFELPVTADLHRAG
jgi:uncharacterized protein YuzE